MGKGSGKSSTNLRLAQGKHNLNANCPKEKLEFKVFFEALNGPRKWCQKKANKNFGQ